MKTQKPKRKILALALCLLLAASCTACGGKGKEEAKAACEDFFQAYTLCDSQMLAESMEGFSESVPFGGLQLQRGKSHKLETKRDKSRGGEWRVPAVITAVDLKKALESLPETIDSTDAAKEALSAAFSAEDVPTKEFEVDVSLAQEDGKWVVQMTPDLADALLGGYYSILEEAAEEAGL